MAHRILHVALIFGIYVAVACEAQSGDATTAAMGTQAVSVDPPLYVILEQQADRPMTLRWPLVRGISSYQVMRGIVLDHDLDSLGRLVEIDPPRLTWTPWARVDLAADSAKVTGSAPLSALGDSASVDSSEVILAMNMEGSLPILGISAVLIMGGEEFSSEIRRAYATKVRVRGALLCWWDFDVDEDSRTDYDDFFGCADSFGVREVDAAWSPVCDFSGDGQVGMDDFYILADWWDLLQLLPKDHDQCGNPELKY